MTRLKKELEKAGIIYEADEYMIMMGPEHDSCRKLVDITKDFIITVFYSAVLDPEIHIFDKNTFEMIAQQNLYPDDMCFIDSNRWGSFVWSEA